MVEGGQDLRLALKPRDAIGLGACVRRERLDRHIAPQPRVGGAIDLAHSASPEPRADEIGADRPTHSSFLIPRSCRRPSRHFCSVVFVPSALSVDRFGAAVRPRCDHFGAT
jgi:hypothetical protein